MPVSLLSTKIHIPPLRTNSVPRPRLTDKLLAAMKRPGSFVLLSGPAGFGKTTLLSEFVAECQQPVAWVSLDEADNDPIRFWTYLVTACQSIQGEIGMSVLALLQTPEPVPDETIPTILINDIDRSGTDVVLILDDFHTIQNQKIHSAISFLLDHIPDHLHFVVSTRLDPPWPLGRFRVRGQLIEIRAVNLRFNTEETAAFLNQLMELNLSADVVAALEARTEGWIASLQLAAISMKGRQDITGFVKTFTGSHIYVAEYLIEEVLKRQPEEVANFLIQTSILERLNASLCDAVTGRADSPSMLKNLYHANLFLLPLDDEGQWFRYHQLFADLLRARLPQNVAPDQIRKLHQHAMTWFAQNGFINEAFNHALAGHDYEGAARLVEENAYKVMTRGELTTLLRWVEALPDDVVRLHPAILIKKAWTLTLAGAIRQVEPLLQQAEAQIEADDKSLPTLELLGNAAAIRAFFAMMAGDYGRALDLAERANSLLPESNVHVSWLVPFTLGSVYRSQAQYEKAVEAFVRQAKTAEKYDNLILWATGVTEMAIVRRLQGQLHEAAKTCHQALQRVQERGAIQFGSLAKLEVPLIEVLREQNKLDQAHQRVTDVIARMQNWPMPTDRIFAYLAQIHVQEAEGDLAGAVETLRVAKDLKSKHPVLANLARAVDLSEIRLALEMGDLDTAARLLVDLPPSMSRTVSLRGQELLMLARLRLAQGKPAEAEKILSPLASDAAGEGKNALIEILALQASALHAMADNDRALAVLVQALTLAESEGFVRIFVDQGKVMRQLLVAVSHKLLTATDEPSIRLKDYVARLLDAFPERLAPDMTNQSLNKDAGLIQPLTSRELEVLRLIAAGDSNQTIADKLVITLSAVKKHTGNIFGKLNVNSRTQAIVRARELGLLSPDR